MLLYIQTWTVQINLSRIGCLNLWTRPSVRWKEIFKSYVEDSNSYVGINKSYGRDSNYYVGDDKSYAGDSTSTVGDDNSYVELTNT